MQLPNSPVNLPVKHLAAAFNHTTASYKFYWFLAILADIETNNRKSIPVNELLIQMVATSWFPINVYKLSFGKSDSLASIIHSILKEKKVVINEKSTAKEVFDAITIAFQEDNKTIKQEVKTLPRNVPFRFLSPFFRNKLSGIKSDHKRHLTIVAEAQQQYYNSKSAPPYHFEKKENQDHIILHEDWMTYFQQHASILKDFCHWNLLNFLQKRNPNIPNIANKLFPPPKRANLTTARKFWDLAYTEAPDLSTCIFSKEPLTKNSYAIDHFLPWSFVAHDQLWNLIPINASANSSKSNKLPDLNKYFTLFAHQHYTAFQISFKKEKLNWLEDYLLLFKEDAKAISGMNEGDFGEVLLDTISPLRQIAENAGFGPKWAYE